MAADDCFIASAGSANNDLGGCPGTSVPVGVEGEELPQEGAVSVYVVVGGGDDPPGGSTFAELLDEGSGGGMIPPNMSNQITASPVLSVQCTSQFRSFSISNC